MLKEFFENMLEERDYQGRTREEMADKFETLTWGLALLLVLCIVAAIATVVA